MGTLNLHRRIAGWFGYELIKKRKLNDTLEQHLANLLAQQEINLVIDVGANVGQFAKSLRRLGYKGTIASFEPLQQVYRELKASSDLDPGWHAHQLALGAEETIATMHCYAGSDFSSMLPVTDFARERFKWRTDHKGVEDVRVRNLSSIWADTVATSGSPTRAFLKLDTQGFDLEVLAGAEDVIDNIHIIQTELSLKSVYAGAPRYLETLAEIERNGFEITGMYPVSRDKQTLAIIEYDCVMSRSGD